MNSYGLVRLSKAPIQNGVAVNFSIAQNYYVKGESFTDFWQCVAFGKVGEQLLNVKKGHRIYIASAEFRNNNYEKDGIMRYNTQIVVHRFEYIEPKQEFTSNEAKQVYEETRERKYEPLDIPENLPF